MITDEEAENNYKTTTENHPYIFQLYVAGNTLISLKAIANARAIFDKAYKDNYVLDVLDIYQFPELVVNENILVVPLLIRKSPLPEIRMIGDLSDIEKVKNEFLMVS